MALVHSPKIVTDGLVFCLDAGTSKSYPGTGTTWTNLEGNRSNVTLTNGPTFDTSNGGNIFFDGTNDYADFSISGLTSTTTVEMWAKVTNLNERMFFGWLRYDVYCVNNELGFNTSNGDVHGLSPTTTNNLGLLNNWKHYVFEMRSDVSYTNNKIYVNSIQQSLSQQRGTESSTYRNFNSGNGRIAGWRQDNLYRMPMNLAVFRVYNKALTAPEIDYNFNFYRKRFGI